MEFDSTLFRASFSRALLLKTYLQRPIIEINDKAIRAKQLSLLAGAGKQVADNIHVCVTGMIEAGKTKTALNRLEQRKVGVELVGLQAVKTIVGINDKHNIVDRRGYAVVIFVPQQNNRIVSL